MSFYHRAAALPHRFRLVLSSFLQHDGLPFADAIDEQHIAQVFDDEQAMFAQEKDAIYTPAVTLWAFLSQSLHKDEQRSCTTAVARVITLLVALGKQPCCEDTGVYCRARAKLSEPVLERLTCETAHRCETQLQREWLWHGRHVYLVDGTTVSMPDTPENQSVYPQPTTQKEGIGFPVARMVVLLSLSSGKRPPKPGLTALLS